MTYIDIIGHLGTLFVVFSFLSKKLLRLRVLSVIACLIFIYYGVLIEQTPVIVTNLVIIGVQIYRIIIENELIRKFNKRCGKK